jgi:stage III sporulation protein AF
MRMDITAVVEENNEKAASNRLSIDEIDISPVSIGEAEETKTKEPPSPMEINMKNKLSDFYNIEQVNINISIS